MKLKEWVSYDKKTGTISVDQTVAKGVWQDTLNKIIDSWKYNLNTTNYWSKIDSSTGAPVKVTSNYQANSGSSGTVSSNKGTSSTTNNPVNTGATDTQWTWTTNTWTTNADGTPKTTQPITPWVTTPVVTNTTNTTPTWPKNWVSYTYDELTPDQKSAIDKTGGKAKFDMLWLKGQQDLEKWLKETGQFVAETNKQTEYNAEQERLRSQASDINNAAQVRQATDNLNKAKANSLYSSASDVTSSAQQTAVGKQLTEMAKGIDDIVALHWLQDDQYAKSTAENARRIQQQLVDSLWQVTVDALNAMDNGLADWTIATNEQLLTLYKQNQEAILKAAPELTNYAVQQLSTIYSDFKDYTENLNKTAATFQANKNTFNKEMSAAKWFAVDGNGNQILWANGLPIELPKVAPIEPVFDDKTGQLTVFSLDEDGNIVGKSSKVSGFVAQPTEDVNAPKASDFIDVEVDDGMGGTIKKKYNVKTGQYLDTGTAPWSPQWPQSNEQIFWRSKYDVYSSDGGVEVWITSTDQVNPKRRQCGEFVNDILNGWPWWIPDKREDKVKMINSQTPVVGAAFIMDFWPQNPNGHTGIVEKVFENWDIQVSDMNRQGTEEFNRRVIPAGSKEMWFIKGYAVKWGAPTQQGNLSPLTQGVLTRTADYKSMTPSQKEKIQTELLSKWAISWKTGNIDFITWPVEVPKEIEAIFKMYDGVKRAQELSKDVSTGFLDSAISKWWELLGGTADDLELKQIVGKNLSMFMKELSGAAVSEQEVNRIKEFMPNFWQGDKKMDVNLKAQSEELDNTMRRLTKSYGFDSVEDMRNAVFGKK